MFGPMQFTEFNNYSPITVQVNKKTDDETIAGLLKDKGISEYIYYSVYEEVKKATGFDFDIVLQKGKDTLLIRVDDEEGYWPGEDRYHMEETKGEKITEIKLSLANYRGKGKREFTYKCKDIKEGNHCYSCGYDIDHYFAHEGDCKDYTTNCTLCELHIPHPEKILNNRCPTYIGNISDFSVQSIVQAFLVDFLYKVISGLKYLDESYVGKFDSVTTKHVRSYHKNGSVCKICEGNGEKECKFMEACRRYTVKKSIESERHRCYLEYVGGEFLKKYIYDPNNKEERSEYEELLKKGLDGQKEANDFLMNLARTKGNFNESVYKQCIDSLRIIVGNKVRIATKVVDKKNGQLKKFLFKEGEIEELPVTKADIEELLTK